MSLPNFKALGISKDMNDAFENIKKTDLKLLIDSEYFNSPLIVDRKTESEFCEVEVFCENEGYWYSHLSGLTFFCEIVYKNYGYSRFISEFKGVKLTNNKMIVFRSFKPEDVIIK